MSKRHKKHSTSVIIKTKDGAFLNLLKLTKLYKDQNLYAYKLFFNNLKLQMLDGAIINGVTGNPINPGVTGENIVGGLEITYHKDGMVMFKDVSRVQDKNLIREKHISLDRLGKPKIFFQTVGLPLRQLRKINFWGLQDNNSPLVRLDDYERQDYVNYFFYIGSIQNKAEITISEHTQHIFQDPFWFSLEDRKNNIMLYIFFWRPKGIPQYTYLNLPSRKITQKMGRIITAIKLGQGSLVLKDWWIEIKSWFWRKLKGIKI